MFLNICNEISYRANEMKLIHGFDQHRFETDKFKITSNKYDHEGTFMDALRMFIRDKSNASEAELNSFRNKLISEEFDSDAIKFDIHHTEDDLKASNIASFNTRFY
eukprot:365859_1